MSTFFGHPIGLRTLFFTEMWERMSYYGMRAILLLYMTKPRAEGGLGFSDANGGAILGMAMSGVYLLSLPGGWLADRYLGAQRAVQLGGILIALGNLCLTAPSEVIFYLGLLCIVFGTGLLKPNCTDVVGKLYAPGDARRDSGYSIYYMGINIGALIAPLVCGYVAENYGYRWGFLPASIGMCLGLLQFRLGRRLLGDAGAEPVADTSVEAAATNRKTLMLGSIALLGLPALIAALQLGGVLSLSPQQYSDAFGVLMLLAIGVTFGFMLVDRSWSDEERKRIIAILILFIGSALFWSMFEQAASTLTQFADRETDNRIGGTEFASAYYQSLNSIWVLVFAPVMAWLWIWLGERQPSVPVKFAAGLFIAGLGFALLAMGALATNGGTIKVSPAWLIFTYLLHTLGELCISPVGLSNISKLAPMRAAGLLMGLWFLNNSLGNFVAGRMAGLYEAMPLATLFFTVFGFAVLVALIILVLTPMLKRLMGRVA
jgi:proton-dependent oligopeptide transporter, POT family